MGSERDIIIIGGGPAGMTAAIYTARSGLDTLVLEKAQLGGQLWWTEKIENYPGFPGGIETAVLAERIEKQALLFNVSFLNEEAEEVTYNGDNFIIKTYAGKEITGLGVIIACGASMKQLNVEGEGKFRGRGVSYCAICDGPLFTGKRLAVVGGGNTACEEANYLTRFADKVYLIHRRPKLRAAENIRNKVKSNSKIELVLEAEIEEIAGNELVEALKLNNGTTLSVNGVFIFIGLKPNTDCIKDIVETEEGFILTNDKYMTAKKGIFAAGDCRKGAMRQVVTACGEGAAAGEQARKYVEEKKGTAYDW